MKALLTLWFFGLALSTAAQKTHSQDSVKITFYCASRDVPIPPGIVLVLNGKVISKKKLDKINLNDITALKILRDSSAVAQHGEQSRKGVIVFETRKQKVKRDQHPRDK